MLTKILLTTSILLFSNLCFADDIAASHKIESARFFTKANYGAEILIDGKCVLRIYSSSEAGVPVYDRAEEIVKRINDLVVKGYDIGSVEPSMIDNIAVGIVDDIPIFSVEKGDIAGTGIPPLLLSYDWSNRLRRAFDKPLLTQDKIDEIVKIEKMQGINVEVKQKENFCEILINGQVVMRTHDTSEKLSSYDKARMIAQSLEESIMDGMHARNIRPAISKGNVFSVKVGNSILSLIDKEEALINNSNLWDLALQWSNKIRAALGTSPFTFSSLGSKLMQFGKASWYGGFFHGRRTSSGERYNMFENTAAHKTLPFGTEVLVTRLDNNKSVVVRVTDRGPYIAGRIIDLSKTAAQAIGLIKSGVTKVRIDVLEKPSKFRLNIDQKLLH